MLEDSSIRRLHSRYSIRKTGNIAISPDSCEELELTVTDIDGSKAHDIYNDIQKLNGLAKDRPIHVTRDGDKVYHLYFWMKHIQFQSSELNVQRIVAASLNKSIARV